MADIVLNYVLALFVFRCGVRRAKHEYIESGRSKVMKLFFGVGMTNYQFLTFCDLKVRALAPPEVIEFIRKTESFSVSGNDSKGEGGDFILEAFNARTKRWPPPGVPKEKHWKQVCRNVEKMEKIRDKLHEEIGIKKKEAVLYQRDISKEIFHWRVKLRHSKYLNNKDNANIPHTSISGNVLDKGLISFESVLNENFNTYLNCLAKGHQPGKVVKLTPLFTTTMDRDYFHDIRNKTKKYISTMIENALSDIAKLGNAEESLVLERQWRKIKVGRKDELLQFYREVTTAMQEATTIGDSSESEDSSGDEYEDE